MSEKFEKLGAEHNNDANGGGVRRRKRIFVTVAILNGLALVFFFIGLQAYGYRIKTAVRASAFKTIGPLPDTGSNPLFDPQATLTGDNRIITVSGMYGCLPAEGDAVVNAIVSQESTGAFARGTFQGSCTGQVEHFTIRGSVPEGSPAFQEGRVKIEALGVNRRGTTEFTFTDLFFWGRFALASKSSDETSATPRSR
jgi:hypothetical protein